MKRVINNWRENKDRDLKQYLPILIAGLVALNIMISVFSGNHSYFLKETPGAVQAPPVRSFCYWAFLSILNHKCDHNIIKNSICQYLEQEDYKIMDFDGSEKLKAVQVLSEKQCRVILEDKRGVRSFIGTVDEDSSYVHGFAVRNFEEVEVKEVL